MKSVNKMRDRNVNYSGSMQDTGKGYIDMENRMKQLFPGMNLDFPRMGGFYYTTPSAVEKPGKS